MFGPIKMFYTLVLQLVTTILSFYVVTLVKTIAKENKVVNSNYCAVLLIFKILFNAAGTIVVNEWQFSAYKINVNIGHCSPHVCINRGRLE